MRAIIAVIEPNSIIAAFNGDAAVPGATSDGGRLPSGQTSEPAIGELGGPRLPTWGAGKNSNCNLPVLSRTPSGNVLYDVLAASPTQSAPPTRIWPTPCRARGGTLPPA